MSQKQTEKRGRCISKILNSLEMQNDIALHYGLGYGFKKMANMKGIANEEP